VFDDGIREELFTKMIEARIDLSVQLAIIQIGLMGPVKAIDPRDKDQVSLMIEDIAERISAALELTEAEASMFKEKLNKDFWDRHAKCTTIAEALVDLQERLRKEEGEGTDT